MPEVPAPTADPQTESRIIETLPQPLRAFLQSPPTDEAVETMARDPAMVEHLRAALPALRMRATRPASDEDLKRILMRHFETYPQPKRSPPQWALWWSDYATTLQGVPAQAIEAAMRAWVAAPDSEFLPKPGRLLELARTSTTAHYAAHERARRVVARAEDIARRHPASPAFRLEAPKAKTMAERAWVRQTAEDLRVELEGRRAPPPPPGPATHGPLAPGLAITGRMRDHLARANGGEVPREVAATPPLSEMLD